MVSLPYPRSIFRAALDGTVMADLWVTSRDQSPLSVRDSGLAERSWQWGCWHVGQTCAAGLPIEGKFWADYFQAQAALGLERLLLSSWPILLITANRWGFRQLGIQEWAQGLGLPAEAVLALEDLFKIFCISLGKSSLSETLPIDLSLGPEPGGRLGQTHQLVQQTQGQFFLALALAQGQGWSASATVLVGLLAAIGSGSDGVAAQLRQNWLTPLRSQVGSSLPWPTVEGPVLWQMADALYDRWAGVAVSTPAQPRSQALYPLSVIT